MADKQKALETAIAQIEKQYGKGSIMKLGENATLNVEAISSGSLSLDVALGIGGLPRGRIIEIYGPESSGKTTVALHVAKSFAELDKRVLLIDADMRKSVMAGRNTNAQMTSGLSEVLTGMCPISECLYPVMNSKMHILFAGQYPPNPVELLNGKYFAALIAECRKVYDYIIIDTPPLGQVIDAAVVAEKCDGMAMVIGSSKVHYRMAQEVVEQIQKSGCKMLGIIRNNRKQNNKKYY